MAFYPFQSGHAAVAFYPFQSEHEPWLFTHSKVSMQPWFPFPFTRRNNGGNHSPRLVSFGFLTEKRTVFAEIVAQGGYFLERKMCMCCFDRAMDRQMLSKKISRLMFLPPSWAPAQFGAKEQNEANLQRKSGVRVQSILGTWGFSGQFDILEKITRGFAPFSGRFFGKCMQKPSVAVKSSRSVSSWPTTPW